MLKLYITKSKMNVLCSEKYGFCVICFCCFRLQNIYSKRENKFSLSNDELWINLQT